MGSCCDFETLLGIWQWSLVSTSGMGCFGKSITVPSSSNSGCQDSWLDQEEKKTHDFYYSMTCLPVPMYKFPPFFSSRFVNILGLIRKKKTHDSYYSMTCLPVPMYKFPPFFSSRFVNILGLIRKKKTHDSYYSMTCLPVPMYKFPPFFSSRFLFAKSRRHARISWA